MFEKAYKEFDNIKPSAEAVNKAIVSAVNATELSVEKKVYKFSKRKLAVSIMAACLVLVFVSTIVFGLQGKTSDVPSAEEYRFSIKANAAQISLIDENPDSSIIGVYCGEMSEGWAMYLNFEKDLGVSPSFFQSYCLSYLNIEGKGIKSITFKANGEGTYFAVSPNGYYSISDNTNSASDAMTEEFTSFSLNNSVYSSKELSECKDGLSYGDIYCDTFTYLNTDNEDYVNLNRKIEYVIEASHDNKEKTELLNRIWFYEEAVKEEKVAQIPSAEKLNSLYLDMSEISTELQKTVLKDATIDVIVKFADGSEQTKTLKTGLVNTEDSELWLTFSE